MRALRGLPDWTAALSAARCDPSGDDLGHLLEGCRTYLLLIARERWPANLGPKEGLSDLVQQTLIEACRDFPDFKGNSQEEWLGWVRQILLHNVLNRVKYYRQERRDVSREVAAVTDGSRPSRCSPLASQDATPSTRFQQAEQANLLDEALAVLPPDYRQVIRLRHEQHLPFAEVGRRLGRTADAAQKLWRRAIEELGRRMQRHL